MKSREAIARLKRAGLPNSQIAEILGVSKQYVSRVCRALGMKSPCAGHHRNGGFVGVRVASRLLGVAPGTVRQWSDQGKIPSSRANGGRRDRRFKPADLLESIARNEAIENTD